MNKNSIKESIDKIDPGKDVRDKMYKNILSKSHRMATPKRRFNPQKLSYPIAAVACVCLIIVCAMHFIPDKNIPSYPDFSNDSDNTGTDELAFAPSPYVEVDDASAYESIRVSIDAPEAADEVTYYIYDTDIACIDFTLDKQSYQLMASRKDGDFSGCTGSVISSEQIDSRYNAIMYIMDTGIKLNWSDGSAQFYLTSQDNSNSDSVKKVFSSIISNR